MLCTLLAGPAAASTARTGRIASTGSTSSTTATLTILPGPLSISLAAALDPFSTDVVFGDARGFSNITGWVASVVATVEVSRVGGGTITRSVT